MPFNESIANAQVKTATIVNNSTARIVHLTISNSEYGGPPYQLSLDYEQLNDLIQLSKKISE